MLPICQNDNRDRDAACRPKDLEPRVSKASIPFRLEFERNFLRLFGIMMSLPLAGLVMLVMNNQF
ncbi:MAG: hypothetical protein ACK5O7_04850 [Holosporales bacterium]